MNNLTIRPLAIVDRESALRVINIAALWYREFLPPEELHGPEMTAEQWDTEARRMTWYGAFLDGNLVGVMGMEYVKDVALLRHGYILPEYQRHGVGTALREHAEQQIHGVHRIVVGTYAGNYMARRMLEASGYRLSDNSEARLRAYYGIPEDRLQSSVTYEKEI
jgi:GNAT superfamily N-acetyltransferase